MPTGFGIGIRPSRINRLIRVRPRKCRPMMMMTMPARIESSADQARIRPPIREALAPSATKTVEKPSTNIRTAISALVLTSIVVSAVGVHLLWWRTAHQVSQTLANTINDQIVSAVGDELQSVTTEARSSMMAVRTLLAEKVFEPRDAGKREVVFRSQLLSQPTISWVAFGWPDGSFFGGHKAGDGIIEMLEITPDHKMRTNRYEFVGNDLQLKNSRVEDTKYSVTDQEWFRTAIETNDELWATFTTHPKGE